VPLFPSLPSLLRSHSSSPPAFIAIDHFASHHSITSHSETDSSQSHATSQFDVPLIPTSFIRALLPNLYDNQPEGQRSSREATCEPSGTFFLPPLLPLSALLRQPARRTLSSVCCTCWPVSNLLSTAARRASKAHRVPIGPKLISVFNSRGFPLTLSPPHPPAAHSTFQNPRVKSTSGSMLF
jgi:hypothetical protein